MLMLWVLLGIGAGDKAEHREKWAEVLSIERNDRLPAADVLSAIEIWDWGNIPPEVQAVIDSCDW